MTTAYSITATRSILAFFSLILFALAAVIAFWIKSMADEPAPEFQRLTGTLMHYSLRPSGKNQRTTVFAVTGSAGRFWTQALDHDAVTSRWKPGQTTLTFSIQTNGRYQPMDGDAVKTFGLMEDGREVQSVSGVLQQEEGARIVLMALSAIGFGGAVALLIYAARMKRPQSSASEA